MAEREDLLKRISQLEAEKAALAEKPGPSNLPVPTTGHVDKVACKLPPFWMGRPAPWFAHIESSFALSGITQDSTKYNHVLSVLSETLIGEVEDIVLNPPAQEKYNHLKTELIRRLSISEEKRLAQLLSDEELGDRKPSQFLRHLKSLAGTNLRDESILRQLWLRRLPEHAQAILATQADLPFEKVAQLADRIVEVSRGPVGRPVYAAAAAAVPPPSDPLERLSRQVEELTRQVASLQRGRSRSQSTNRFRSRTPSSHASRANEDRLCWYHRRFGPKATKCIGTCTYEKNKNISQ